jgi:putative inorganic carbon (hco3(-)) transporter
MKNKPRKLIKKQKELKKQKSEPLVKPIDMLMGLIILAYVLIPTFTPNWMSLDTNTPKFFMTALLNLAVFSLFLSNGYFKNNLHYISGFFRTNIGLVYSGFLLVSLLSFTQSVNMLESVLQFTKVFTVFAAVFNMAMVLMRDLRYVRFIVIIMTALLIFDSVSVFYYINKFINGEVAAISDIKTVYSNKNILASSIYVKLAFAIWLMVFEKGWLNRLGWFALACGIAATFFMATRAFYLGLIILYLIFIAYNIVLYFRYRNKRVLLLTASSIAAIFIAFFAFTFVQSNLYPEIRGRHTQGVLKQLSTLKNPESASSLRLDAWRWSIDLIKEKPLLGVGSGNWKIQILKHENQKNAGFIYLYKAHNDFLETAAETGIIGGLLFLGIFIMIFLNFFKHYSRKEDDPEHLTQYLFLAAAGVAFYSVDAVFNFPADRPEILALFILFVSAGIAATYRQKQTAEAVNTENVAIIRQKGIAIPLCIVSIALLAFSTWVLRTNFQSSINQRVVYQEIMAGNLKEPSDKIIAGFPVIPNVSIWGEPIATLKARYLIQEEKNEEAVEILRFDFSSPWDARREFFMAMAFNNMKEYDSALHYSEIAAQLKPNYFRNIHLAATLHERNKEYEAAAALYDNYLASNKRDKQAYLLASNLHIQNKNLERAKDIVDEGLRFLPRDKDLQQQETFLNHRLNIEPHLPIFNRANEHFQKQQYNKAIETVSEFLELVPDHAGALQIRSFSYYHTNEYEQSIADANKSLKLDASNSSLINLRGVCLRALNKLEEACADFKKSMEMGNASGKINFERFCDGQ